MAHPSPGDGNGGPCGTVATATGPSGSSASVMVVVEKKLEEQANFARSPDERRSQIPSIMQSLQHPYKKAG
jgi:hypothetical protein